MEEEGGDQSADRQDELINEKGDDGKMEARDHEKVGQTLITEKRLNLRSQSRLIPPQEGDQHPFCIRRSTWRKKGGHLLFQIRDRARHTRGGVRRHNFDLLNTIEKGGCRDPLPFEVACVVKD